MNNNSIAKLKVSRNTDPKNLASAIVNSLTNKSERVEITAIGAAATNQVAKAIAIARGMTITRNKDIACKTSFSKCELNIKDDGAGTDKLKEVTGITFTCFFDD